MNFFTIQITSKNVHENNVYFSTSKITPKKVRGNSDNFSTSEIISKNVFGNNADFSSTDITLIRRRFFEVWSLMYLRNINVELASTRCGVSVVFLLCLHRTIIRTGITCRKSIVICATQLAGSILLKNLNYFKVMLNIFEFSRV